MSNTESLDGIWTNDQLSKVMKRSCKIDFSSDNSPKDWFEVKPYLSSNISTLNTS